MDANGSFLSMRDVRAARDGSVVLDIDALDIDLGEHLAILGPNGCGKSTLIALLTRELYPVAVPERCRLLGRERWDIAELRTQFGVVGTGLPGERTAEAAGREAVLAGFFSSSALWPHHAVTPAMEQAAEKALGLLGAGHLATKRVRTMSAGEQKRVMIARALVHRPRTLLLDEPSNALDLAAQRELRLALRAVARAGTGILLVTHHLGDILPEIERVVLMRAGRIFADGPKESLLEEGLLSALFGVPVELSRRNGWLHAW